MVGVAPGARIGSWGDRVEFRLLGPLEVRHGGAVLALGGPRQRAVLAVLVLRANEVVTVRTLVEAVWESAPASADTNIRT